MKIKLNSNNSNIIVAADCNIKLSLDDTILIRYNAYLNKDDFIKRVPIYGCFFLIVKGTDCAYMGRSSIYDDHIGTFGKSVIKVFLNRFKGINKIYTSLPLCFENKDGVLNSYIGIGFDYPVIINSKFRKVMKIFLRERILVYCRYEE